jgi:adenine-specific DNA-methyltransferase
MAKKKKPTSPKEVTTHTHEEATRKNIPSAEMQPIVDDDTRRPIKVAYERRNRDLDPQLIWRGKYPKNPDTGLEDMDLEEDLTVNAPPLYIQERVNPKVLIDDLVARTKANQAGDEEPEQLDLFGDFDGVPDGDAKTEFYQHDANWSNRMILGDSLQVMASLAEREGLRGKVQCIYFDPPYGIKFNSNFQWSTDSRNVKDGKLLDHRQPEQVKAFRDTWKDGINSFLIYIRARLEAMHDLLSHQGSMFFQIGDENVHLVKCILDEVFGSKNSVSTIVFTKTTGLGSKQKLSGRYDFILWYAKDINLMKINSLYEQQSNPSESGYTRFDENDLGKGAFMSDNLTKPGPGRKYTVNFQGKNYNSGRRWWGTPELGMKRLGLAGRLLATKSTVRYKNYHNDFPLVSLTNLWDGLGGAKKPNYVVETNEEIVKRCILQWSVADWVKK